MPGNYLPPAAKLFELRLEQDPSMQPYEYINKDWIVSQSARRVYRAFAVISLALYPAVIALAMGDIPRMIVPALRLLLFASVVGTGITMVGMEFFLFRFDDSHALKQIVWFVVMLLPPLGPAMYCFVIYSRSKAVGNVRLDRVGGPRPDAVK